MGKLASAIASCTGKERFTNFQQARVIAGRVSKRHASAAGPYRCRHCNGFHVGATEYNQPRKRPKG